MTARRNPTHAEHMATLDAYLARGGPLWTGPRDSEILEDNRRFHERHGSECAMRCEARCGTPMDRWLLESGYSRHPTCGADSR